MVAVVFKKKASEEEQKERKKERKKKKKEVGTWVRMISKMCLRRDHTESMKVPFKLNNTLTFTLNPMKGLSSPTTTTRRKRRRLKAK